MKRTYIAPQATVVCVEYNTPIQASIPEGPDNFGKENDFDEDEDDGQNRWNIGFDDGSDPFGK